MNVVFDDEESQVKTGKYVCNIDGDIRSHHVIPTNKAGKNSQRIIVNR